MGIPPPLYKVDRSFGDIPLVHGMPFVSGVGIEAF